MREQYYCCQSCGELFVSEKPPKKCKSCGSKEIDEGIEVVRGEKP